MAAEAAPPNPPPPAGGPEPAKTQEPQQPQKGAIYQPGRAIEINKLYNAAVTLWEEAQLTPYAAGKKNTVRQANLKLDAIWLAYLNPTERAKIPTFNEVLEKVAKEMTPMFWNEIRNEHDDLNTVANKKEVVEARLMFEALNIRLFVHFYEVFVSNDWFDYKPDFAPWGGGKGPDPRRAKR